MKCAIVERCSVEVGFEVSHSMLGSYLGFFMDRCYMKQLLIVCFFLLSCSVPAKSNNSVVFTSERELPSSMVNQVFQDSDDVIWFATEGGLVRYDGAEFVTFLNNESDSASLQNNYVRLLHEDNAGRFFVGTLKGFQLYDPDSRSFTNIQAYIDGMSFPGGVNVSCMATADSVVFVGTSGYGIFELNVSTGGVPTLVQDPGLLPNCFYIEKMLFDSRGNLWVATMDKGVFVLDGGRRIIGSFLFEGNESCFSLVETDKGIYIGTSQGRLLLSKLSNDNRLKLREIAHFRNAVVDIYRADSTSLMIGTDGSGLKVYNEATGELSDYNLGLLAGVSSQKLKVHSIMRDRRGNLWLGCFQQGVVLEPVTDNEFVYIGSRSSVANTIGACCVMSVTCDGDKIWVGTDNDGIYQLNADFSLVRHFPADNPAYNIPRTTLCIRKDTRGNVWVGSYLEGLFRLNASTGRCESFEIRGEDGFGNVSSVYSMVEDANHNLWVAVAGRGLCRINTQTFEQKMYNTSKGGIGYSEEFNQLSQSWINTLLLVGDKLYYGGYDGFGCLDTKSEDFVSTLGSNRLLAGEVVYALREGADGEIWIGTANGLFKFDTQAREFVKYTMSDGLPSNSISSIECDSENNLWVSTNNGISCFVAQDNSFSNYYASDGLQCNEFSKSASSVSGSGMLFYGGVSGMVCFYPQNIKKHYSIPKIRIANFYIHDKEVTKGMLSGGKPIVDCDITKAEDVYLSHTDNSFSIGFTAMEFANPERISYLYNMDGNGWIHLQHGSNKVSFSNLSYGTHEFSIKAASANSFSKTRKLTIHIAAPWYATTVAYIAYLLILILAAVLVLWHLHRGRILRAQVLEHKHAEDINEAKLQFFMNISHEIRTPMSLIIGPLYKLIGSDKDAGRQRTYDTIRRNAERILGLINQLMDIRKIDKGQMQLNFVESDVVGLARNVCANFNYQAELQDIVLSIAADIQEIKAWVDPDSFDKIITNIISNAFKFTPPGGYINVSLKLQPEGNDDSCVIINIEDSGTGINPDDLNRIFDRFYQSGHDKSASGTGIGLHLTKLLVELHHGTIEAHNNIDKPGCHFIVKLPVGSNLLASAAPLPEPAQLDKMSETMNVEPAGLPNSESDAKKRSKTKYQVLVVEDDEEIRRYIKEELSSDFHVQECTNGAEALDIVLRNAPDIVVSDVLMPVMDGKTLCQKIKQNITVNYVPVVLLTSLTSETDRIEGLDVGADAYMTKPFNIEVLRHTVMNLLRSRATLKNKFMGRQSQAGNIKKLEVSSPDDRLMQRVMTVVNKNLGNPDLSVEMVASTVGISRVHLHRKLRELTNQTGRDFIRNMRLQQAATLLSEKRHSISEIAEIVGFQSVPHFSTAFKELYGMSPSDYMEQSLSAKDGGIEHGENT